MSEQEYQQGILINFASSKYNNKGAKIDFNKKISGFNSVVQDALINTISIRNKNLYSKEVGTSLLPDAWSGRIFGVEGITHAANFAASDTINFTNNEIYAVLPDDEQQIFKSSTTTNEYMDLPQSFILTYNLKPLQITENGVVLNAYFASSKGETKGVDIETSIIF